MIRIDHGASRPWRHSHPWRHRWQVRHLEEPNMRWKGRQQSSNVEDRRGSGGGRRRGGGAKLSGGAILLIAVVSILLGQNPLEIIGLLNQTQVSVNNTPSPSPSPSAPVNDEAKQFVSVVLKDTEQAWHQIFQQLGGTYREPTLVLFSDMVQSACGRNSSAVGPFYCPADQQVYIDLTFFEQLQRRFGAPGDFAQAYVIAHEVGHHVQTLLGISSQVHQQRARASREQANALSVRQELQADCFAGLWGHYAATQRDFLENGDIEEGLRAAAAIGDDQMQRHAGQAISPESWTHGSSAQRVRWFRRGLEHGKIELCDTFEAREL